MGTAYLTAAVAEKPLLLIEGLPSVDVYNVRNERIDEAYEILRESGCVMDYRELYHRPLTFRTVKEEFLKKQVYRPKSPSAAEIVRIMEQIKAEIIDKRQYILTVFDTDAGKLEELLPTLLTVSRESETAECTAEARRKTNEILQRFRLLQPLPGA